MFSEWYRHLFLQRTIILQVFVRSFSHSHYYPSSAPPSTPHTLSLPSLSTIYVRSFAFEFHEFVFNMHADGTFSLVVIDVDVDAVVVVNVDVVVKVVVVLHC